MTIPDEAVEAAKDAMREVTPPTGVTNAEWLARHGEFALIAGAIAAAAPYLMAQAWDEGFEFGSDRGTHEPIVNPYRA